MEKHRDKISYFRDKIKHKNQIERKLLNISINGMEKMFSDMNAIEVFRGNVISYYYDVPLDFVARFFGIDSDKIRLGSSGGFLRLREMFDDDSTELYFAETRIKNIQISIFGADYLEYGRMFDHEGFEYLKAIHDSALHLRETEKKKRIILIIPNSRGLEYCLDTIYEPFNVEPYMEVEADSMEKYLSGISLINKTHDDFVDISARRLIEQKRNK